MLRFGSIFLLPQMLIFNMCAVCNCSKSQITKMKKVHISSHYSNTDSHSNMTWPLCMMLIKWDCPWAVFSEVVHGYSEYREHSMCSCFLWEAPSGMFPSPCLWLLLSPAAGRLRVKPVTNCLEPEKNMHLVLINHI